MSSTAQTSAQSLSAGTIVKAGAVAVVAAVLVNVIVYFIGTALIDVPPGFMPLSSVFNTILFTTLFTVIGVIVLVIVARLSQQPMRTFWIIAVIALLLSFIPDLMLWLNPSAMPMGTPNTASMLLLIVMHVVAFAVFMGVLGRMLPRR